MKINARALFYPALQVIILLGLMMIAWSLVGSDSMLSGIHPWVIYTLIFILVAISITLVLKQSRTTEQKVLSKIEDIMSDTNATSKDLQRASIRLNTLMDEDNIAIVST